MAPDMLRVCVACKQRLADGIVSFELVAADGSELPPYAAGAHIDVHLPNGLVRQYSLCNPIDQQDRYVLGVLRDPSSRGGSACLHDQVKVGDYLTIGSPRNLFPLHENAGRSLLLAGGIGITPILAMAESLNARGAKFDMHYCARSAGSMAFKERIAQSAYADRVRFHLDDGPAAQRIDLSATLVTPADDAHLYVCGPPGFIAAVISGAQQQGWADANVHTEHFGAAPATGDGDTAFTVRLQRSGMLVDVPADKTVVAALASAGVVIPTSCEQGVCGTCLTNVVEGLPDHRDQYLTPTEQTENRQFLPCVSRARCKLLVIDL